MTENPAILTNDDELKTPIIQKKLLTVILEPNDSVNIDVRANEFEGFPENERSKVISGLLQQASLKTLEESGNFQQDQWKDVTIPINNGSLYDELFFESAIYVNNHNQLSINTSFGRLYPSETKLGDALRLVSDVLLKGADHFHPIEEQATETIDEPEDTFANRF